MAVAGIPSEWNLSLCPLAVDELNNHCRGSARQHVLDSDIRKLGSAVGRPGEGVSNKSSVMRDNVTRQIEKATLAEDPKKGGGVLLQLIKATDISKPAAASATYEASKAAGGGGGKRVLLLQATDGTQKVSCLEVDKVDNLNLGLPPGTKLLLDNTTEVMNGQVLLRPNKVKVLGGTVERLVEAWKANKLAAESRFGASGESTRTRDVNADGPPKFVSFANRNKMHKRQNMNANVTADNNKDAPSSSVASNGPSSEAAPTARFTREELGESTVPQAAVPEIAKVSKDAFKSKFDRGQGSTRKPHVGKHTRRNEARALEAEYSRPSAGGASLGAYINLSKSDDMAAAMLLSEEEALPPAEPPRQQSYGGKGKGRYYDDHYQHHNKGGGGKHGKGSHSKGGGGKGHRKGGKGKGKGRW